MQGEDMVLFIIRYAESDARRPLLHVLVPFGTVWTLYARFSHCDICRDDQSIMRTMQSNRRTNLSFMLLLIIVCAEINNVGAVVEQHRLKSSAKAAGIVVASSKEKEEKGGDVSDPEGGFLSSS